MESPIPGASPCPEDDPSYPAHEEEYPPDEDEEPAAAAGGASMDLGGAAVNLRGALEEVAGGDMREGGKATIGDKREGTSLQQEGMRKKPCLSAQEVDEDALLAAGIAAIEAEEAANSAQREPSEEEKRQSIAAAVAEVKARNDAARARGDGMCMKLPDGRDVFIENRPRATQVEAKPGDGPGLLGKNIFALAHELEERQSLRAKEGERRKGVENEEGADEENRHPGENEAGAPQAGEKKKNDQLWVDKYAPRSFMHLLSDDRTNRNVLAWLKEWDPVVFGNANANRKAAKQRNAEDGAAERRDGPELKILMLHGPPGVGKTTLAHILARQVPLRPHRDAPRAAQPPRTPPQNPSRDSPPLGGGGGGADC